MDTVVVVIIILLIVIFLFIFPWESADRFSSVSENVGCKFNSNCPCGRNCQCGPGCNCGNNSETNWNVLSNTGNCSSNTLSECTNNDIENSETNDTEYGVDNLDYKMDNNEKNYATYDINNVVGYSMDNMEIGCKV